MSLTCTCCASQHLDQINTWLKEGQPYSWIEDELKKLGAEVSHMALMHHYHEHASPHVRRPLTPPKQRVIMVRGLPGSGKTTWCKALMEREPGRWKRVSRDDLRAMLDSGTSSRENERVVIQARDFLIRLALQEGYHVVVDDTNLRDDHASSLRILVGRVDTERVSSVQHPGQERRVEFSIEDLTSVPLAECIKRDQARQGSVGAEVIRGMHKRYLAGDEHGGT